MKSLLVRFQYKDLRNEAHVEYHETVDETIVKYNPQILGIKPLYDAYKPLLDTEVSLLDQIRKSEYTSQIAHQDHVRDNLLHGFADAVRSLLRHFDETKRTAAERIHLVMEHYGNISVRTFDQETAAIDDLLRELFDNHRTDIDALSLEDWLMQLDAENRTFKTLMTDRYVEMANRPTTRMKTVRAELDKAFRALLNMIEAQMMVNGETAYRALVDELNAVSERYKNQLAQAAGRRKEKQE